MQTNKEKLKQRITETLLHRFGCTPDEATELQFYKAICIMLREELSDMHGAYRAANRKKQAKQVYYMSMEFLTGPSLYNHAFNLDLKNPLTEALADFNISFNALCHIEPDAGLGNGGLGRLAACYLDALTTQGMPATGFSIRYEFGIFKQKNCGWLAG